MVAFGKFLWSMATLVAGGLVGESGLEGVCCWQSRS